MKKIGIFYGTDSGNARNAAENIAKLIGEENIEIKDIANASKEEVLNFENLILVTSTYGCGDLQGDWEDKIDSFNESDFKDKTIALVGIGDSDTYSDTFCDSLSYLYEKAKGGNVIGKTSSEGYDFSDSKAILDSGEFMGLVLDYDNQEELNEQRISNWVKDITPLFS